MKVSISNCVIDNSGLDNVRVHGDVALDISNTQITNAKRHNIVLVEAAPDWLAQYNLPEDTELRELAEVLQQLRALPEVRRQTAALETGLLQRWLARGFNAASLAANIVTISAHPAVQPFIKKMLGG